MSIDAVCWAYNIKETTPLEKLILIILANSINSCGDCVLPMAYLAEKACVESYDVLFEALNSLERKKIITHDSFALERLKKYTDIYTCDHSNTVTYVLSMAGGVE